MLKNNFRTIEKKMRTRPLWPYQTSGGRSPSANKLKFIKIPVYNKIVQQHDRKMKMKNPTCYSMIYLYPIHISYTLVSLPSHLKNKQKQNNV